MIRIEFQTIDRGGKKVLGKVQAPPIKDQTGKVISSGRAHYRIKLLDADSKDASIVTYSKKILKNPPRLNLLEKLFEKLGLREVVILHVKDADGNEGYVKVNKKSLEKRLKPLLGEHYRSSSDAIEGRIRAKNENVSIGPIVGAFNALREASFEKQREAFFSLQKIADKGVAKAFQGLALCYSLGKGVNKNSESAREMLREMIEAAKNNEALLDLYLSDLASMGVIEVEEFAKGRPRTLKALGVAHLKGALASPSSSQERREK